MSTIAAMRSVAEQANRLGRFDAVIHNVAVGYRERTRAETEDGLPLLVAVNVMVPYVLTALMQRPARLVYLSSGMHQHASAHLDDLLWKTRRWEGSQAYAESKLHDALLAFAMARRWPDVKSNVVEPGWVATRMGGPNAPDDLDQGHRTQAWLAASDDAAPRCRARTSFTCAAARPTRKRTTGAAGRSAGALRGVFARTDAAVRRPAPCLADPSFACIEDGIMAA